MTKQKSYPYVLVSEFSRKAAKNLDESRDLWNLARMSDVTFGAIPVGDDFQVSNIEDADHELLLSDIENLEKNYVIVMEDVIKLQKYFGGINGISNTDRANIWGKTVSLDVYRIHRKAINELLNYKRLLQTKMRLAIVEKNRARAVVGVSSGSVKRLASFHAGKHVELINGLSEAIATCAKIYGFIIPEKFNSVMESSKSLIDYETHKYIERVGIEKINKFIENVDKDKPSPKQLSQIVNELYKMNKAQVDEVLKHCMKITT